MRYFTKVLSKMSGKLIKKQVKAFKRAEKMTKNGQMRFPLLAPKFWLHKKQGHRNNEIY